MAMTHPGDVTLATYEAAAQRYVNQAPASPSGALIETHAIPADLPNKCCVAGVALDTIYVSTGGGQLLRAVMTS